MQPAHEEMAGIGAGEPRVELSQDPLRIGQIVGLQIDPGQQGKYFFLGGIQPDHLFVGLDRARLVFPKLFDAAVEYEPLDVIGGSVQKLLDDRQRVLLLLVLEMNGGQLTPQIRRVRVEFDGFSNEQDGLVRFPGLPLPLRS